MTEPRPTVTVDEKLFQEVKTQHARVIEARDEYESSREETKRYKASLEGAQQTLESLVRRLTAPGEDDLPLFANQSEQIDAANADPVVRKIVDRLVSLGHDVNTLIVAGYNQDERGQVLAWLEAIDAAAAAGELAEGEVPMVPEPPAFLIPQPLTPIEAVDLSVQLAAEDYTYEPEAIQELTAVQVSELRHWLAGVAAVRAEKGEAVTFDDLPAAPGWMDAPDGLEATLDDVAIANLNAVEAEGAEA